MAGRPLTVLVSRSPRALKAFDFLRPLAESLFIGAVGFFFAILPFRNVSITFFTNPDSVA